MLHGVIIMQMASQQVQSLTYVGGGVVVRIFFEYNCFWMRVGGSKSFWLWVQLICEKC